MNLEQNKEIVIQLLHSTHRKGIDDLIEWMSNNNFFIFPASISYHSPESGGLAYHSIMVTKILLNIIKDFEELKDKSTEAIICGLLHDLCKCTLYQRGVNPVTQRQMDLIVDLCKKRNIHLDPVWIICKENTSQAIDLIYGNITDPKFLTEDQAAKCFSIKKDRTLHLGHAEHSLYIINKYIDLTDEEATAIRWHMGTFENPLRNTSHDKSYGDAIDSYPLVSLLHYADMIATTTEKFNLTLTY